MVSSRTDRPSGTLQTSMQLRRELKLAFWRIGFGAGVLTLLVVGISVYAGLTTASPDHPAWLGNTEANRSRISRRDANDLSFVVIGDTHLYSAKFEELLALARQRKPDFLVIVGDFADEPTTASHDLFVHRMAMQDLPFPVLLIPGDHDYHPRAEFREADFVRRYGRSQFHVRVGNDLYIFLDDTPGTDPPDAYLRYLHGLLRTEAGRSRNITVFMHAPPKDLPGFTYGGGVYRPRKFFQLCRRYGVDLVFTGDCHGYFRCEREGTTFVVTGGGGGRLRGPHGDFHHFVHVSVVDGEMRQEIVRIKGHVSPWRQIERMAATDVWSPMTASPLMIAAGVGIVLLAAGASWVSLARAIAIGRNKSGAAGDLRLPAWLSKPLKRGKRLLRFAERI